MDAWVQWGKEDGTSYQILQADCSKSRAKRCGPDVKIKIILKEQKMAKFKQKGAILNNNTLLPLPNLVWTPEEEEKTKLFL